MALKFGKGNLGGLNCALGSWGGFVLLKFSISGVFLGGKILTSIFWDFLGYANQTEDS